MDLKQRYMAAKQKLFDKAYANLNSARRGSFSGAWAALVLAGAGSGKRRCLSGAFLSLLNTETPTTAKVSRGNSRRSA